MVDHRGGRIRSGDNRRYYKLKKKNFMTTYGRCHIQYILFLISRKLGRDF